MACVAAFALASIIFVFARFSFGYFVGFYWPLALPAAAGLLSAFPAVGY
jgi:hypothetical protein